VLLNNLAPNRTLTQRPRAAAVNQTAFHYQYFAAIPENARSVQIETDNNPRAITKRPRIPFKKKLFHVTDTKSVNIIEDDKTALPINKLLQTDRV